MKVKYTVQIVMILNLKRRSKEKQVQFVLFNIIVYKHDFLNENPQSHQ